MPDESLGSDEVIEAIWIAAQLVHQHLKMHPAGCVRTTVTDAAGTPGGISFAFQKSVTVKPQSSPLYHWYIEGRLISQDYFRL